MKRLKLFLASLTIAIFGAVAVVPATTTYALDPLGDICSSPDSASNEVCKNKDDDAMKLIGVAINALLFIVGALAVVMIIYGGIRYTTSAGNTSAITAAKNTILYAVVGLVVSFLAYAVVNWVLKLF
jgi:ABC-type Fe3+ transport system permease subunit